MLKTIPVLLAFAAHASVLCAGVPRVYTDQQSATCRKFWTEERKLAKRQPVTLWQIFTSSRKRSLGLVQNWSNDDIMQICRDPYRDTILRRNALAQAKLALN